MENQNSKPTADAEIRRREVDSQVLDAPEEAKSLAKKLLEESLPSKPEAPRCSSDRDTHLPEREKPSKEQAQDKRPLENKEARKPDRVNNLPCTPKDAPGIVSLELIDPETEALRHIKANFRAYDTDNNGHVTREEISSYSQEFASLSDGLRTGLRLVQNSMETLEEYSNDEWLDENDGITRQDVEIALEGKGSVRGRFGDRSR